MKRFLNGKRLAFAAAGMGILGWALRAGLYAFFVDNRGLLPRYHPVALVLWLVSVLTAALLAVALRHCTAEEHFNASLPAAIGHILLAAGILLTVLGYPVAMAGRIGQLWKLLGVASAPILVYGGISRALGRKPFFLSYVVVCVFFALHLVCHYRIWCSDPQLQNYVFAFLGTLGLMVFAYYQAEACVTGGNGRKRVLAGLLAAYLCLVSLSHNQYLYLYLGGAIWTLTASCCMDSTCSAEKKAGGDCDSD